MELIHEYYFCLLSVLEQYKSAKQAVPTNRVILCWLQPIIFTGYPRLIKGHFGLLENFLTALLVVIPDNF